MSKLANLLTTVNENVSFYNDNIPTHRLKNNNQEEAIDILKNIPIVSKHEIKSSLSSFLSKKILTYDLEDIFSMNRDFNKEYQMDFPDFSVVLEYTSGSSGVPFATIKTTKERFMLGRNLWKLRNGIRTARPDNCFYFIHTFKDNLYPFPFHRPKLEKEKVEKEIEFLKNDNHSWWHINSYILSYYYTYLNNHSMNVKFPNLKVIENNGSYISDEEKRIYSDFFSCEIANNYGSREVWGIAYDCQHGYLHVNEEDVFVELVDDQGEVINQPGVEGSVIVTSLKQEMMPFIRYKLYDYASYISGECICGNKSKRINLLPGRNVILGTNMYGNKVFKDIISFLCLRYKMTNYHSISALQEETGKFLINIKGNQENKALLEEAFVNSANFILKTNEYRFEFSYNDQVEPKSLFQLKISSK